MSTQKSEARKHLAFWWVDVEAVRTEGVVPQVQHVLPAAHPPILHGVGHLQHGAALAGLVPHHQVLREEIRLYTNTNWNMFLFLKEGRVWLVRDVNKLHCFTRHLLIHTHFVPFCFEAQIYLSRLSSTCSPSLLITVLSANFSPWGPLLLH